MKIEDMSDAEIRDWYDRATGRKNDWTHGTAAIASFRASLAGEQPAARACQPGELNYLQKAAGLTQSP